MHMHTHTYTHAYTHIHRHYHNLVHMVHLIEDVGGICSYIISNYSIRAPIALHCKFFSLLHPSVFSQDTLSTSAHMGTPPVCLISPLHHPPFFFCNSFIEVWLTYSKLHIFQVHNLISSDIMYTPMKLSPWSRYFTYLAPLRRPFVNLPPALTSCTPSPSNHWSAFCPVD